MKINDYLRQNADIRTKAKLYTYWCPGCNCCHTINDTWEIHNLEPFDISPSVLTRSGSPEGPTRCHCFIKEGKIQFLNDCTHELVGKTVDMVPHWADKCEDKEGNKR